MAAISKDMDRYMERRSLGPKLGMKTHLKCFKGRVVAGWRFIKERIKLARHGIFRNDLNLLRERHHGSIVYTSPLDRMKKRYRAVMKDRKEEKLQRQVEAKFKAM